MIELSSVTLADNEGARGCGRLCPIMDRSVDQRRQSGLIGGK